MGATITCNYCERPARLVDGRTIYPHRPDLARKKFYHCRPCTAYVGCHPGTEIPLGRLANASLRKAKQRAHSAFDPLWRERPSALTRSEAYAWLAGQLGIHPDKCHIGMFDETTCAKVVDVCRRRTVETQHQGERP